MGEKGHELECCHKRHDLIHFAAQKYIVVILTEHFYTNVTPWTCLVPLCGFCLPVTQVALPTCAVLQLAVSSVFPQSFILVHLQTDEVQVALSVLYIAQILQRFIISLYLWH